jgi:predicted GIY-YIG superfamily endonuclease
MRSMKARLPSNVAYVYGLICPATHVVRYVGQTKCIRDRYLAHCRGQGGTREWI